jgi:hypothetical protein
VVVDAALSSRLVLLVDRLVYVVRVTLASIFLQHPCYLVQRGVSMACWHVLRLRQLMAAGPMLGAGTSRE